MKRQALVTVLLGTLSTVALADLPGDIDGYRGQH